MQHEPWVGEQSAKGLDGQTVAIVGYSHWGDPSKDRETFTNEGLDDIVRDGKAGWRSIRFFSDIMHYFGETDPAAFWPKVIFFNFAPRLIGLGDRRYDWLSKADALEAGDRALGIYKEHEVDKALVFSNKGWSSHPATDEERAGSSPVLPGTRFHWGHYGPTVAVGLRHPQGASGDEMKDAVRRALDLPTGAGKA